MHKILFIFLSLFIIAPGLASVITQNVQNGCYTNDSRLYMDATWTPNKYTCSPGYFLPANAINCVKCSPDHTCPGGTYVFNETVSQGIKINNIITTDFTGGCMRGFLPDTSTEIYAKWTINSYDCGAGYYLPADGVECAVCPNDNYCPGGTYTYSETITQGIKSCPDGLFSAPGMSDPASCGRILHIGNETVYSRSQKKTTPSLNIDMDADGVPDFFLNTTPTKTTINNTSLRYLHIGEYYVYDDTIAPESE